MNAPSLFVAAALSMLAVEIQLKTGEIISLTASIRRQIMSSQERCPTVYYSTPCVLKVSGRRAGNWDICDTEHPPSGADLPMHRWFRVTGHCELMVYGTRMSLPLPPQLVYR